MIPAIQANKSACSHTVFSGNLEVKDKPQIVIIALKEIGNIARNGSPYAKFTQASEEILFYKQFFGGFFKKGDVLLVENPHTETVCLTAKEELQRDTGGEVIKYLRDKEGHAHCQGMLFRKFNSKGLEIKGWDSSAHSKAYYLMYNIMVQLNNVLESRYNRNGQRQHAAWEIARALPYESVGMEIATADLARIQTLAEIQSAEEGKESEIEKIGTIKIPSIDQLQLMTLQQHKENTENIYKFFYNCIPMLLERRNENLLQVLRGEIDKKLGERQVIVLIHKDHVVAKKREKFPGLNKAVEKFHAQLSDLGVPFAIIKNDEKDLRNEHKEISHPVFRRLIR